MFQKDQVWFLLISILVHTALVAGLLADPAHISDKINLQVEYRKLKGERTDLKSIPDKSTATPSSQAAKSAASGGLSPGDEGDAVSILGSDVGIKVQYPRLSRVLREAGAVEIEVEKDSDSRLIRTVVSISSGYPRLDKSALEAAQMAWNENRLNASFGTKSKLRINFVFKLKKGP